MSFPQFPFTDFCLLALILAILGGFSFLEVLLPSVLKRKLDEERIRPLRRAASWAVIGAIVTLIIGALSQVLHPYLEDAAVITPLVFLVTWALLHMLGSSVVSSKYLESEADQYYLPLIERVVREHASKATSTGDKTIRLDCIAQLPIDQPWWAVTAVARYGGLLVPESALVNLLGKLALTEEKFDNLVGKLVKTNRVRRTPGGDLVPVEYESLPGN